MPEQVTVTVYRDHPIFHKRGCYRHPSALLDSLQVATYRIPRDQLVKDAWVGVAHPGCVAVYGAG